MDNQNSVKCSKCGEIIVGEIRQFIINVPFKTYQDEKIPVREWEKYYLYKGILESDLHCGNEYKVIDYFCMNCELDSDIESEHDDIYGVIDK